MGRDLGLGAVSFLHRFGSAMNPHPHFHLAVTDDLFTQKDAEALTFHPAVDLDAETAGSLTAIVQRRILRLWVRRDPLAEAEAADMLTWRGTEGFSPDGSVRLAAHDRAGVGSLLRYCARPPFALHRLRHATPELPLSSPDARVIYHLTRPARDGRSALRLAPLELLERLARLIPPPPVHRHRSASCVNHTKHGLIVGPLVRDLQRSRLAQPLDPPEEARLRPPADRAGGRCDDRSKGPPEGFRLLPPVTFRASVA